MKTNTFTPSSGGAENPPVAKEPANPADNRGGCAGNAAGGDIVRQSLTLDEFVFDQLRSLEAFETSWRKLNMKNDEIYPLEMFSGDWSEQLAFFLERDD